MLQIKPQLIIRCITFIVIPKVGWKPTKSLYCTFCGKIGSLVEDGFWLVEKYDPDISVGVAETGEDPMDSGLLGIVCICCSCSSHACFCSVRISIRSWCSLVRCVSSSRWMSKLKLGRAVNGEFCPSNPNFARAWQCGVSWCWTDEWLSTFAISLCVSGELSGEREKSKSWVLVSSHNAFQS